MALIRIPPLLALTVKLPAIVLLHYLKFPHSAFPREVGRKHISLIEKGGEGFEILKQLKLRRMAGEVLWGVRKEFGWTTASQKWDNRGCK